MRLLFSSEHECIFLARNFKVFKFKGYLRLFIFFEKKGYLRFFIISAKVSNNYVSKWEYMAYFDKCYVCHVLIVNFRWSETASRRGKRWNWTVEQLNNAISDVRGEQSFFGEGRKWSLYGQLYRMIFSSCRSSKEPQKLDDIPLWMRSLRGATERFRNEHVWTLWWFITPDSTRVCGSNRSGVYH